VLTDAVISCSVDLDRQLLAKNHHCSQAVQPLQPIFKENSPRSFCFLTAEAGVAALRYVLVHINDKWEYLEPSSLHTCVRHSNLLLHHQLAKQPICTTVMRMTSAMLERKGKGGRTGTQNDDEADSFPAVRCMWPASTCGHSYPVQQHGSGFLNKFLATCCHSTGRSCPLSPPMVRFQVSTSPKAFATMLFCLQ